MARSSKHENFSDVAEQAQQALDFIISGEGQNTTEDGKEAVPVSQALQGDQIVSFESDRSRSRVLFVSSDQAGWGDGSALQRQLRGVGDMFAEVHAVVLTHGKKRDFPSKRLSENVWLYHVQFSTTWFLDQIIKNFAETQMQLGTGFRPDVIVALDPFYAGQAAAHLGKVYDRPVQIHVLTDFLNSGFASASKENKQMAKIAHKLLKHAKSVRVNSSVLKNKIEKEFPKIEDLGMLPRHYDSDAVMRAPRSEILKTKYPQYKFVILTAGALDHDNTVFRTLDAARPILLSPRIGMVIVGDGPMRSHLQERAKIFGITEQVVFETNTALLNEYLLSADMFICTDPSAIGDEYVIQAAAAGLPIVMSRNALREDLFVDNESALFCDAENTAGFSQKITTVLNTAAYRLQFGTNARLVIKDRLHTDPELYRRAYRDMIEVVFGNDGIPEGAGPDDLQAVEAKSET